jgi:hypothetical protein
MPDPEWTGPSADVDGEACGAAGSSVAVMTADDQDDYRDQTKRPP